MEIITEIIVQLFHAAYNQAWNDTPVYYSCFNSLLEFDCWINESNLCTWTGLQEFKF